MATGAVPLLHDGRDVPEQLGPWGDTWARFRQNRAAVVGLAAVVAVGGLALAAPVLTSLRLLADPLELNVEMANSRPSLAHPLGTDGLGRDLLSRTLYGARVSLSIGMLLQAVALLIGGTVGLAAGFFGGRTDALLMRFTDLMYAFPDLLFVLFMAAVLGPGYWNLFLAIGLISWPHLARLVRAQVLAVKGREYIDAARAAGTRPFRIVVRHVVPNAAGLVIVSLAFAVPAAIFIEAFLSFVGIGLRPPTPSWGVMVNQGYLSIFAHPHQVVVPVVAIALTTVSFNFIGDGLRDALDPRMRA